MTKKINKDGEVFEPNNTSENMSLILAKANELQLFKNYNEKREIYLAAKEQFEIEQYKIRKYLFPLMQENNVTNFKAENDNLMIYYSSGYFKKKWNDEKVESLILSNNEKIEDYKEETWVEGGYKIKNT